MKKLIILSVLAFATPALASELSTDMVLGTNMTNVQSKLTDMGYQVRKSEIENGDIEVYVVKGGKKFEIYVSMASGKITRIKSK